MDPYKYQHQILTSLIFFTSFYFIALLYYVGAGRRGTGDWCFEDGFITFRDIAQLYLRALSHNFKGRVLTIVSDCSYSGCWVRDCMEFLDEQGVQPCGHKAREKGILIKVFASCKSNATPTKYRFLARGTSNVEGTGLLTFKISKKLFHTQTTDSVNSSILICNSTTIDQQCTLPPGLTWSKWEETRHNCSTLSPKSNKKSLVETTRLKPLQVSRRFYKTPTKYRFLVHGTNSVEDTELLTFKISKELFHTQTTDCIPPGLTWSKWEETRHNRSTLSPKVE